ncbi:phosphate/phosphite/phosphonate ABC transporter substrate-binding protein [Desulfobacter sp.]|uniref:phosphate/phosphite/phosphonate ABC transporter substrate-binding protein n=1 Tax=Desulfobacter sp. TaxID=2294 RepID=UPI003D0A21AF
MTLLGKLVSVVSMLCCLTVTAAAEENKYEMGAFPNMPVARIQALFTPMADAFAKALGKKVQLSSKPTFEKFEKVLNTEFYDIAHIQPFDYIHAHDKHNYLPLARRGGEIEALFVVLPDSKINKIQDLRGKKVLSPPPDAAVSHLANRSLQEAGLHPEKDVRREYSKDHFSCLQNVLIGEADVGISASQMIKQFENEKNMSVPFKVIHKTIKIPNTLIVVHKRVPQKDRDILLKVTLTLENTAGGRKILDELYFKSVVPAEDSDYDVIRKYISSGK